MLPSPGRATLQVMLEPESKHQPHCVVGASANALMNSLPAQSQSVVQLRYNTWRETTEDGAQPTASELCSCTNFMPRAGMLTLPSLRLSAASKQTFLKWLPATRTFLRLSTSSSVTATNGKPATSDCLNALPDHRCKELRNTTSGAMRRRTPTRSCRCMAT